MTYSATDLSNIVQLRRFTGSDTRKIPDSDYDRPAPPRDSNDRFVADSLQLVRSFMLIDDVDMRASIIRLVEKIAEQNNAFK